MIHTCSALDDRDRRVLDEVGVGGWSPTRDARPWVGWRDPEGEKRGRRYRPAQRLRDAAGEVREEVNRRFPVAGDPYA
ncbi:hypothetical protein BLA60_12835 [Actinophytocola xinjiangensis]|uniref:Uncharacterized protein n=1 Tax=Actinophytocola xinjiangensis TaxID=485602 RepID=A0A7Z1AZC2_9PSEU|nr:hypothetical protein [Actinophytocola xinjiangensis]OLF10913.1 hypothetical protein BLA60_12835 [Actinophytocola xinjiangensis]